MAHITRITQSARSTRSTRATGHIIQRRGSPIHFLLAAMAPARTVPDDLVRSFVEEDVSGERMQLTFEQIGPSAALPELSDHTRIVIERVMSSATCTLTMSVRVANDRDEPWAEFLNTKLYAAKHIVEDAIVLAMALAKFLAQGVTYARATLGMGRSPLFVQTYLHPAKPGEEVGDMADRDDARLQAAVGAPMVQRMLRILCGNCGNSTV
jgi:hypothetical protein